MTEIIEISSSPVAAPRATSSTSKLPFATRFTPSNTNFDFDENFFDETGSIDFSIDRSSKRRKISPVTSRFLTKPTQPTDCDAIYLLSSDSLDHDVPILQRATSMPGHKALPENVGSVEINEDMFFSSSAPPAIAKSARELKDVVDIGSVDDLEDLNLFYDDPIETSSQPVRTANMKWSRTTAKLLADLEGSRLTTASKGRPLFTKRPMAERSIFEGKKITGPMEGVVPIDDNIIDSSQPRPSKKADELSDDNTGTSPKKKRARKTDAQKEAEKEAKRLEKESRAAAKKLEKDMVEVNKVKTNKNVAVQEMMLDMPAVFKNKSLGNQVEEFMKEQGVPVSYYSDEVDMTNLDENGNPPRLGSVIKWRRKLMADYDEETDEWTPLSRPKITSENHIIVHLMAEEFAIIIATSPTSRPPTANVETDVAPHLDQLKQNLDLYITLLRSRHPSTTLILLIQGLSAWLKKNASAKNRAYSAAVRAQNAELLEASARSNSTTTPPSASSAASKKRKMNSSNPQIDLTWLLADHIEDLSLHLQLHHAPIQLIHTTSPATSGHQILLLTQHLATRPYRLADQDRNLRHANFCMGAGQFKTGQGDARETWVLMLEKLGRLTVSMAQGIVAEGYESPTALYQAFKAAEERDGRREAMLLLEDVRKAANKDGAWSDRRLGKEMSKRLYKVFMGLDPASMDGIS